MAQYKVPQDVEAEDKLLGPFTFRQFIYLVISLISVAMCWALFQVFPLLLIIPIPLVLFFGALALPLRKDQPMETYLGAVVSFHLKNNKRRWMAGQRESTIEITAPKKTEENRARDITEEEAGHRLSFLADLVDTEGYAIKNGGNLSSAMRDEYAAEANATPDILDTMMTTNIDQMIAEEQAQRHAELVNQMRTAIERADEARSLPDESDDKREHHLERPAEQAQKQAAEQAQEPENPTIVTPISEEDEPADETPPPRPDMVNLANNTDLSVQTISKEASRLKSKPDNEVYISLH